MGFKIKNICCIGAGYVGGPTMAIIADKCPHITVNVVDINSERIEAWNNNDLSKLPVYEPGLDEVVERTRSKNLHFSCDIKNAVKSADMVFISVNTPTKKRGEGAGKASDLKYVEACARQVGLYASNHTIVVEKSTIPVRTAEVIKTILESVQRINEKNTKIKTFDVLSNPEFLAEGTAIKDLEFPDRVLIGGQNNDAIEALSKIYRNWVPNNKILKTNIWSSELAKLTANAFLAQRISSINAVGALCEATGADVREVSKAIGADKRIGTSFIDSGPGFGGSCFKKDILNLVYLCEYYGLKEVADYWHGILKINEWQQKRISNLIIHKLNGTVSDKKISILGFAFKADTNDTRESPSMEICLNLLEEGAILAIHDPKVEAAQIENDFKDKNLHEFSNWSYSSTIEEAIKDSHAVVILTEWEIYKHLNWLELEKLMSKPSWVFNTRTVLNIETIEKTNINYWRVGNTINKK